METLVAYESLFGRTHAIAEAIAAGLRPHGEVRMVPVGDAGTDMIAWAYLVIVGGPTHIHGMSRSKSREDGRARAAKPDTTLTLDPAASGPGVREWLDALVKVDGKSGAAFDTRVTGPALITGRASGAIARGLRHRGFGWSPTLRASWSTRSPNSWPERSIARRSGGRCSRRVCTRPEVTGVFAVGNVVNDVTGELERAPRVPPRGFVRSAWVAHRALYRTTGGRVGLRCPTPTQWGMMRLRTTGRRSGEGRSAILGATKDGPNSR